MNRLYYLRILFAIAACDGAEASTLEDTPENDQSSNADTWEVESACFTR
ncbi:MAG: hypothetical protein JXX29_11520 [Deltaproteobacteria bacterium]|nr:hypothetical protein [Deltaproteobacteria bacterium]